MPLKLRQKIIPVNIEEEMKKSYLDYSMSVIVGRALPDVRDGLKPVHRRILYAMSELSLYHNRGYKKSARLVGETMGKYHPHGDQAIYDTVVRMAQDFSMRYPLVDGQGNFGSIDGDPAAAMRYTEVRMTAFAEELLRDIDKETVDMVTNFDDTLKMPSVLPSIIPNLLVNGASGIAVGMATNIPPHNLNEVIDALLAMIENPNITIEEIMEYIPGPDFPTGGIVVGTEGIKRAYKKGRGRIKVRGKAFVETQKNGRESIIINELPYVVNKANLIAKIASLVRDKKLDGISDIRDESDREGLRIVIEVKRGSIPEIILNQLYKYTRLQNTFGIIMIALQKDNVPKTMSIKTVLRHFLDHRKEVVTRRTQYELKKAEARAHILEGLKKALDHIDEVIQIIKKSSEPKEAKARLMERFEFSDAQAQAILNMRLQRLTNLERKSLEEEYLKLIKFIEELKSILANPGKLLQVIKDEFNEIKEKYGDSRRTDIIKSAEELSIEDLMAEEEMVITISHQGYIKRLPVKRYKKQARGGRGVTAMTTKEEDWVESMFIASTHSWILFFTNLGNCYWLKVRELPEGGRRTRGRAIVNLLNLSDNGDEMIKNVLPVKDFEEDKYIIMATRQGLIKKTELSAFSNPRTGGIIAIKLVEGDDLIEVGITDGTNDIIVATRLGMAIRFPESDVRAMGRNTQGVKAITLKNNNDSVVGMVVVKRDATLMTVAENGYGKRTKLSEYRSQHRAGKGVINIKAIMRNGPVVSIKEVLDEDELMIITYKGMVIRLPIGDVSIIGRNTQGVKLINLQQGDRVVDVARLAPTEENKDVGEESDLSLNAEESEESEE
jgi:DNA gyrase subunit A